MNEKYSVYVDMDGVLADFDSKALEITGGQYGSPEFSNSKFWKRVYQYNSDVEPFFQNLPKMSGADDLINFLTSNFKNVSILTATGTTPKDAAQQKRAWIEKYYPGIKVITVISSREKAIYANPRSVLIDDREKAIDPWKKAGGIGVLFQSTSQAINDLNELLS